MVVLHVALDINPVRDWVDYAQGAAAVAQVIALIVGGVWAYFKFARGRTFARRLEPVVAGELLESGGKEMFRVRLRVRNAGASRVTFAKDPKAVYLYATASSDWSPGANVYWPKDHLMLTPVLGEHKWIEAGETVTDEVLVPVPEARTGDAWLAYRLEILLASDKPSFRERIKWSTGVVVPAKPTAVLEAATTEGVEKA